ncbi:MAG: hypothetical protein PHH85_00630 [Candidatus Methanoperedens sp.]|nr:hypothetical protein [Candidatus Methanoperedens sp.]
MESNYGWHDHELIARIKAYDAHSGIAAISYTIDGSRPFVSYSDEVEIRLDTEGVHNIEYSSIDNDGNPELIRTSQVKLDLTAPEISIISPEPRVYLHSDIITLDFSGSDALSGIFSIAARINGAPVTTSQDFDMLSLSPGAYVFRAAAQDNAGNIKVSTVNFTVISNMNSLIALNQRTIRNGWITEFSTAQNLTNILVLAGENLKAGKKEQANNILKTYINEIEMKRGKTITEYGADILITEASYAYISNA